MKLNDEESVTENHYLKKPSPNLGVVDYTPSPLEQRL